MTYDPVAIARQFLMVRETQGQNRGHWVDAMNTFTEAPLGSPWCASFASVVLWIAYQDDCPLPITASSETLRSTCAEQGWITTAPAPGDLFFYVHPAGTPQAGQAHHVGFVTGVGPLTAIAGNTSQDGTSTEGGGVYEHAITSPNVAFAHLPT